MEYTLDHHVENFSDHPDVFQENEDVEFTEFLPGTPVAIARFPGLELPDLIEGDTLVYTKIDRNTAIVKDNDNPIIRLVKDFEIRGRILHRSQASHETVQPITVFGMIHKEHFWIIDIYVGNPNHGYFANRFHLAYVANRMGLSCVPVLYRGPFSRELVERSTTGPSVAGLREYERAGIIIIPLGERHDPRIGRVVLKSTNPTRAD